MATTDFSARAMTSTSDFSMAAAASGPEGGSWAQSETHMVASKSSVDKKKRRGIVCRSGYTCHLYVAKGVCCYRTSTS